MSPETATQGTWWVHDLSPFVFQLGSWGLRWYSLAYLAGVIIAILLAARWHKRGRMPLNPHQLQDAGFWVAMGMIVGARLYYCLFYFDTAEADPPFPFLYHPLYFFKLWEGGMASHGGAIGLAVGALLYWWRMNRRFSLLVLLDTIAALAPFGVIFGRLANFVNGELWGRPTDIAWGVKFPDAIQSDLLIRYRSGELGELAFTQLRAQAHTLHQAIDQLGLHYSAEAEPCRDLLAFVDRYGLTRHPSQLYAMAVEGLLVLAVGLTVHALHRRPGLTAGAVLATYGAGRFFDEFFREPDVGYDLFFGWMSKGQLYSLPMALCGLGLLIWAARRPSRPELYTSIEE